LSSRAATRTAHVSALCCQPLHDDRTAKSAPNIFAITGPSPK
jgi:hypothetical protein